jgi:hypothetical protein
MPRNPLKAGDDVVNVSMFGGINQEIDPLLVTPPELLELKEATVVKPGRIEKRNGFDLVGVTDGTPASSFNDFGGATAPPDSVEALSPYYGSDGDRMLLAAGSKLYEWVGSDQSHQWRTVNKIPEYVGTLESVMSSGGSVIETESLLISVDPFSSKKFRVSAWVTGSRTGQELTSDLVYSSQTVGDGNSVYYAMQDEETGAYVIPPTRAANVAGTGFVQSAINLRLVALSRNSIDYPLIAWQSSTGVIEHLIIDAQYVSVSPTVTTHTAGQTKLHRTFDICALRNIGSMTAYAAIVFTAADTNLSTPGDSAKLPLRIASFDLTTGVATTVASITDIIAHTPPASGPWFNPWAQRGVVLQQDPEPSSGTFTVAFAARVVSRYYTAPATPTNALDGQIVLGTFSWAPGAAATRSASNAYVPFSGFTTQDDHTKVLGTTVGNVARSGFVNVTQKITTNVNSPVYTASTSGSITGAMSATITTAGSGYVLNNGSYPVTTITSTSAGSGAQAYVTFGPGPTYAVASIYFESSGTGYNVGDTFTISTPGVTPWTGFVGTITALTGPNSSIVVTGTLADGTKQPYLSSLGVEATNPALSGLYTVLPVEPYYGADRYNVSLSGVYPVVQHTYTSNNDLTISVNYNQTNQIEMPRPGPANTGFTASIVVPNVQFMSGGNILCIATVATDASGAIVEVAIQDGSTTFVYGPGSTAVTSVIGVGLGAGTLTGAKAINYIKAPVKTLSAVDVPYRALNVSNAGYVSQRGLEDCVHRWSVDRDSSGVVVCAIATTASTQITNPSGDAPYGAADPHTQNNQFEVYKWSGLSNGPLRNIGAGGGSTSNLITSLGGPWRLVSGLAKDGDYYFCGICPGGDTMQQSTFLVRVGTTSQTVTITDPGWGKTPELSGSQYVTYSGSTGVFVESCNMMRVTSAPFNTPRLLLSGSRLVAGGLRNGSSKGTQEVFLLSYEKSPANWRSMAVMSDYTFVNGGVLSCYDGASVNESSMLLWPQKDYTTINWNDVSPELYIVSPQNAGSPLLQNRASAFYSFRNSYLLINITRPWFKYEAGFNDKNGVSASIGWGSPITTYWGGNPSDNYESVYADPRISQLSIARTGYASGMAMTGSLNQHYYGRYHSAPAIYDDSTPGNPIAVGPNQDLGLYVWAPRNAAGWASLKQSQYNAADAAGDFIMRWTYEYADATGRMVRSCPSVPATYTVCAQVFGAWANSNDVPKYTGGQVFQFRYGFFAPRLELTNRLSTAASDSRRVVLQPYTTAEPYSTVLYRMPFSSFVNPSGDFVIGRNESRGIAPYSSIPYGGANANPLGFVTDNFRCLDGPTRDYNGILAEPYLYTTGDVLDNVAPPACKAMCVHQNRLVIGGADDASVIWFSKELSPTDAPGFNDALTINIQDGGPVTGLASLGENLIVFKKADTYIVSGTMPDATGRSTSFGTPYSLPSGLGCIDHRSIIETPIGVFFQSARSIELLKPNLEIFPIGDKVQNYLVSAQVISVAHNAKSQEVYFSTTVQGATNSYVLVYNYLINGWYTWDMTNVTQSSDVRVAVMSSQMWVATKSTDDWNLLNTPQAFVYKQNSIYVDRLQGASSYTLQFYPLSWIMGPFSMSGQQGFQRVKRVRLFQYFNAPTSGGYAGSNIGVGTDGGVTGGPSTYYLVQNAFFTEAQAESIVPLQGFLPMEVHCANQKGQLQMISYTQTPPSTLTLDSKNVYMNGVSIVVGLKEGLNKRITEQAKH